VSIGSCLVEGSRVARPREQAVAIGPDMTTTLCHICGVSYVTAMTEPAETMTRQKLLANRFEASRAHLRCSAPFDDAFERCRNRRNHERSRNQAPVLIPLFLLLLEIKRDKKERYGLEGE
jgi:hypothetical protein